MEETVTVEKVQELPSGWTEVELGDGRKASTKNPRITKVAIDLAGTGLETVAVVNKVEKGRFTNFYLNRLGDETDEKPKASRPASSPARSGGRSPAEQDRIRIQWALGRATELAVGSGEYALPLSDADKAAIVDSAKFFLESADSLEKR